MFPEPTELLLVGNSIESIWTPKSKSDTLTPKNNSLHQQKVRGKPNTKINHFLSPQTEKYDSTGRPVVCALSSSHSEWNETLSSQEWKSDELMESNTGQHTDRFNDVM